MQNLFRFQGASKAIEGIFSAAKQSVTSDGGEEVREELSLFFLFCESKFPEKTPYTVTFYTYAGKQKVEELLSKYPGQTRTAWILNLCPQRICKHLIFTSSTFQRRVDKGV